MRETLIIIHLLGLVLGLGTSFGFMFLGIISSKLPNGQAKQFRYNILGLSRMGHIGIGLLILSGFGLMPPHWVNLAHSKFLIIKFILVVILILFISINTIIAGKIKHGKATEVEIKRMKLIGQLSLLTGILIVIFAVLNFN